MHGQSQYDLLCMLTLTECPINILHYNQEIYLAIATSVGEYRARFLIACMHTFSQFIKSARFFLVKKIY